MATDQNYHRDQVLGDKYRIISELGKGGMGVVYRVENILLHKEFALKTIARKGIDAVSVRRFQAEARAAYSMNHPNIVSVNDFGIFPDGTPFLAMQIVEGQTLADVLKTKILSEAEAIPLFLQVCNGLSHAHEAGVVHRDIKSSNIMLLNGRELGTEGSVKILDFGIAKLTQHDGGEVQALTKTGEIFGSPLFMSPEQCAGTVIDQRSDIYSLGCVMFEALTGTPPFVGDNALSTMMMHQTGEIPTLREASLGKTFSPEMEAIVARMLAKKVSDRYQNVSAVKRDLLRLSGGVGGTANTQQGFTQARTQAAKAVLDPTLISLSRTAFGASILAAIAGASLLTATGISLYSSTKGVKSLAPVVDNDNTLGRFGKTGKSEFSKGIDTGLVRFEMTVAADDESLAELGKYPNVQSLEIYDSDVSVAGLASIKHEPLINLVFSNCGLQNVEQIVSIDTLQHLTLANEKVTLADLQKLAKLPSLFTLDLHRCVIPEDQFKTLLSSTSLHWIEVPDGPKGPYSKAFLQEVASAMPQCSFLIHNAAPPNSLIDQATLQISDPKEKERKRIELARKVNPKLTLVATSEIALSVLLSQTNKQEALKLATDAVSVCRQNHDNSTLVAALVQTGNVARDMGDIKQSNACRLEAFPLAKLNRYWDEPEIYGIGWQMVETTFRKDDAKFLDSATFLIGIGKRFPNVATEAVANIIETVGWHYMFKKDEKNAAKYFDEECAFIEPLKEKNVTCRRLYARALASRARITRPEQKEYLKQAIEEIQALGMPDDIALPDNYNDCCTLLANIYGAEKNPTEAADYNKKALVAIEKMKAHPKFHPKLLEREQQASMSLAGHLREAGKLDESAQVTAKYQAIWPKK